MLSVLVELLLVSGMVLAVTDTVVTEAINTTTKKILRKNLHHRLLTISIETSVAADVSQSSISRMFIMKFVIIWLY